MNTQHPAPESVCTQLAHRGVRPPLTAAGRVVTGSSRSVTGSQRFSANPTAPGRARHAARDD